MAPKKRAFFWDVLRLAHVRPFFPAPCTCCYEVPLRGAATRSCYIAPRPQAPGLTPLVMVATPGPCIVLLFIPSLSKLPSGLRSLALETRMKRVQWCVLPPERREREQSRGCLNLSFPMEFRLGYIETGHCSEVQLLVAGVCKWPRAGQADPRAEGFVGVPTSDAGLSCRIGCFSARGCLGMSGACLIVTMTVFFAQRVIPDV